MAISKSDFLFDLIKSLSKSEKRSFRLFAERISDSGQLQYMRLFDLIEKQRTVDEEKIKKQLKLDPGKYANVKRHLYEQILTSLRLTEKSRKPGIKVRETIDFSFVLYGKGLYMQALNMLDRARKLAEKDSDTISLLNIIEIEKMIHSRFITRAKEEPIREMVDGSRERLARISNKVLLSDLQIVLHQFYIINGHARNKKEERKITDLFRSKLPDIDPESLDIMEKVMLYQSYVWYHYIINDFENFYSYASKWLELFRSNVSMQARDVNLYLRGFNYTLAALFHLRDRSKFETYLSELDEFRHQNYRRFNLNTKILSFLYVHTGRLNKIILSGNFDSDEAESYIRRTLARIRRYGDMVDEHKIMVFYFKIAWIYMRAGQPERSLDFLAKIMATTQKSLRSDIQVYTRLMHLMALYDLSEYDAITRLLPAYRRYASRVEFSLEVTDLTFELMRQLANAPLLEHKALKKKYRSQFKELSQSNYARKSMIYLDVIDWLRPT